MLNYEFISPSSRAPAGVTGHCGGLSSPGRAWSGGPAQGRVWMWMWMWMWVWVWTWVWVWVWVGVGETSFLKTRRFEASFRREMGNNTEFEASFWREMGNDTEFEASFWREKGNDTIQDKSFFNEKREEQGKNWKNGKKT